MPIHSAMWYLTDPQPVQGELVRIVCHTGYTLCGLKYAKGVRFAPALDERPVSCAECLRIMGRPLK